MKKMLLAAVVFFVAQMSMAAGLTAAELAPRVERFSKVVEQAKAKAIGRDFTKDAEAMKIITRAVDDIVSKSGAGNTSNLIKLMNSGDAKSVMMEVGRLNSIIIDKKATDKEKADSKKALELLSESANSIPSFAKTEAEGKEHAAQVELALKISEKIAKFNDYTSDQAKAYAKAYETAIKNGSTPREAMKEASKESKKEITEDDLNCDA